MSLSTYLEEVRLRAEKASPGPWFYDCGNGQVESANQAEDQYRKPICDRTNRWDLMGKEEEFIPEAGDNCEFIAHSRTDIEKLLAIVETQRKALEFYATEQDMNTPGRKEYGCGCCCWTVGADGEPDYERCQGLTAKEVIAECDRIVSATFLLPKS